MKFLKENSYDIIRLYINQVGITIFSLIMYTAAGMVGGDDDGLITAVKVAISCFSSLFFFALIYMAAWDWGAKDKIRIEGKRIACDKNKGIKMSFVANLPNVFLSVCTITFALVFHFFDIGWAASTYAVFNLLLRFTDSMYIGLLSGLVSYFGELPAPINYSLQAVGFLLFAIVAMLVTHCGYRFGLVERRIFSFKKK